MNPTLEEIWTRFAARLRFFIRGRVADDAAAEDILQNVFVKIQQRLDTLRDGAKLESWVHQIARHAIVDHYRAQRPAGELPDDLAGAPDNTAVEEEKAALFASFHRMISELPEPYREAVRLTELGGLTQLELAGRLGLSLSGAKSRVQRGRAMLRDMLEECCRFSFDRRGTIIDYEPRSAAACSECKTL